MSDPGAGGAVPGNGTGPGNRLVGGCVPRIGPVLALRVPADDGEPVTVVLVRPSSVALSDAIGGGLIDDALVGGCEGDRFGLYLDEERVAKNLPPNDRAAVLLVRLGHTDREWLAGLCGDAVIVGVDGRGGDCDVAAEVLVAACGGGFDVTIELDPAVNPRHAGRKGRPVLGPGLQDDDPGGQPIDVVQHHRQQFTVVIDGRVDQLDPDGHDPEGLALGRVEGPRTRAGRSGGCSRAARRGSPAG